MTKRKCGDCQLCCKLVPVAEFSIAMSFAKPAFEKCPHQRYKKGCRVYWQEGKFPRACGEWSCRWVLNMVPENIPRPDKCGLVIDIAPDHITVSDTGKSIPVIQIWVDHKRFPDAHMKLGEAWGDYFSDLAEKGWGVIFRPGPYEAQFFVPDGQGGIVHGRSDDENCRVRPEDYDMKETLKAMEELGGDGFKQFCEQLERQYKEGEVRGNKATG